jgi:hypothetical protein
VETVHGHVTQYFRRALLLVADPSSGIIASVATPGDRKFLIADVYRRRVTPGVTWYVGLDAGYA